MKRTYWIYGTHAVESALENPRRHCHRLCVAKNPQAYQHLRHVKVEQVDAQFFQTLFGEQAVHQGIALEVDPLPQVALDDFLQQMKNTSPLLLAILDQVTDPHNMGAILRSAVAFGVQALIVPEKSSPSLISPVLAKAASGAIENVPIVQVVNLSQAITALKKESFWILGLDAEGTRPIYQDDLRGRYVIVLGAEGKGMRRLTAESCDILVRLPTSPTFTTLNVSNAAAVAFYEFYRQNKLGT